MSVESKRAFIQLISSGFSILFIQYVLFYDYDYDYNYDYYFIIRYINNSLPTLKNMARWGLRYHKVLIAPFALILNHSFMLSLVVNSTLIALPGDTTQSLTSLPSHFNL